MQQLAIARNKEGTCRIEFPPGQTLFQTSGWISQMRFSRDGQWIYFIRIEEDRGKFALGGQGRTWYDLETPSLMRMKPDGSAAERLATGPTRADAFTKHLVSEIGVAAVPGSSFYRDPKDGAKQVRFAFCKKPETLDEASRRLSKLHARK